MPQFAKRQNWKIVWLVWPHISVIQPLGLLKQKDHQLKASLGRLYVLPKVRPPRVTPAESPHPSLECGGAGQGSPGCSSRWPLCEHLVCCTWGKSYPLRFFPLPHLWQFSTSPPAPNLQCEGPEVSEVQGYPLPNIMSDTSLSKVKSCPKRKRKGVDGRN